MEQMVTIATKTQCVKCTLHSFAACHCEHIDTMVFMSGNPVLTNNRNWL